MRELCHPFRELQFVQTWTVLPNPGSRPGIDLPDPQTTLTKMGCSKKCADVASLSRVAVVGMFKTELDLSDAARRGPSVP